MKLERMIAPLVLLVLSCGGGTSTESPPQTAQDEYGPSSGSTGPGSLAPAPGSPAGGGAGKGESAAGSPPPKIDFPPNANVEDAIKAVPQGLPRLNMADADLQKPLMELSRYERCKVPRSTKVTLRVAVFDGAAVGVDISSKPKSPKIEECVAGVVRSMAWEKVPSLNTMTFTF